ncbi:cell division protein SepF [Halanaerobaculum tunisiense]
MDLIDKVLASVGDVFGIADLQVASPDQKEITTDEKEALGQKTSFDQENVAIIEPDSFAEVQQIVDHLTSGSPVIVKLTQVTGGEAVKIVEFVSGAVYALDGYSEKIEENVFLFTPATIEINY